jgi:hypothetical protein
MRAASVSSGKVDTHHGAQRLRASRYLSIVRDSCLTWGHARIEIAARQLPSSRFNVAPASLQRRRVPTFPCPLY